MNNFLGNPASNLLTVIGLLFFGSIPSNAEDVYALTSGKNIYARAKKDAVSENLQVFQQYEAIHSKKIIAVCANGAATYAVAARWDVSITSNAEAEDEADKLCAELGAFGGTLIGYKIKKDIRF